MLKNRMIFTALPILAIFKKKKTKKKAEIEKKVKKGYVISIVSPKGGVGKTVTAVNLALALSTEFDKKVVAIDTNITTASLGFHFNIIYPVASIYDILKKNFSIKWAIHHYSDNLDIIPASIAIEKRDRDINNCLLYTSPSPRDISGSRMPSSA